jgi:hypothetical protein
MAGKGDKWRKDFDFNKYWTNFSALSSGPSDIPKSKKKPKKIIKKGGKTTYVYD